MSLLTTDFDDTPRSRTAIVREYQRFILPIERFVHVEAGSAEAQCSRDNPAFVAT